MAGQASTRVQLVHLSSAARVSGSAGNAVFDITPGLIQADDGELMSVSLLSAAISRSWYSVVTGMNDSFRVSVAGGGTSTVTISQGYHTILTLKAALQAALPIWAVQLDKLTNRFSFTPPNDGKQRTLLFTNACCELLGFQLSDAPVALYPNAIVSTRPARLNSESAVLVHCSLPFARNACVTLLQAGARAALSTTLASIPCTAAPFDVITQQTSDSAADSLMLLTNHVHSLSVWLTDQEGRSLEPAYDWTLTLRIEYKRQENRQMEQDIASIRRYVQYFMLNQQAQE